jgi:hypothetical protein
MSFIVRQTQQLYGIKPCELQVSAIKANTLNPYYSRPVGITERVKEQVPKAPDSLCCATEGRKLDYTLFTILYYIQFQNTENPRDRTLKKLKI